MKKIRFAVAITVLAAIFHFIPFFDKPEAWLVRGFLGVGGGIRSASFSVGDFFKSFASVHAYQKENAALKEQVRSLNEKLAAASAMVAENESLKGLLSFKDRTDIEYITAEIIGVDPDATVRGLVINRGTESGIVRGDAVIAGDGTLVGKIERTVTGRSTVLLPTDPRSAIAVMVTDHPETSGVAQGAKGLAVAMTLIPQHAPLDVGAIIVTTGREGGIPRGLVLGKVESIVSVASDPFMSAIIMPSADPLSLTKVAVIHQK